MTGTVEYRDGAIWRRMRVALFRSVPGTIKRRLEDGQYLPAASGKEFPVAQILEADDSPYESGHKIMASDLGAAVFTSPDHEARKLAREAGWKTAVPQGPLPDVAAPLAAILSEKSPAGAAQNRAE